MPRAAADAAGAVRTTARARRAIARHIENLLADGRPYTVAYLTLIRYGERAREALLEATGPARESLIRCRALMAAARVGGPGVYEAMLRLASDDDERVRFDAQVALGILGDERAIPVLAARLKAGPRQDEDGQPAAMGLERFGEAALPALLEAAGDADPTCRLIALNVLANLGSHEAVEAVRRLTRDPDPLIAHEAAWWLDDMRESGS
jgi:HEAT repeat protein